ncbi:MAG TPA: hypothetical protein VIV60_24720, partial [Polyangiaceae bacterium]
CAAKSTENVLLITDDERRLLIDVTTGRQTETKERCEVPLAFDHSHHDPRDRRDYSAPLGTESYDCGGVRVMGSENYVVPDACLQRGHVDSERLDGVNAHRIWKLQKDWLIFGVREPGARVPMVARLSKGKLVWKAQVPTENPLDASEGAPQNVALIGDLLAVAYETRKESRWFVTLFALGDGARRWTVPVTGSVRSLAATSRPTRVVVQRDHDLLLLDPTNGNTTAQMGRAD